MHRPLREGLSFCLIDDHAVFMDLAADRYFELPASLEDPFLKRLGFDVPEGALELLRAGILDPVERSGLPPAPTSSIPCCRSVMELPEVNAPVGFMLALEVFGLVYNTFRQLRKRPLHAIIGDLVEERRANSSAQGQGEQSAPSSALVRATTSFLRARIYAPVDTSCLLDSLALCRFLERRHLPWTIVFGVTRYPFAAHCWVQVGDLALNDSVGNALAHTAIRVV